MTTISTRCPPTRSRLVKVLRFADVDGTGRPEPVRFEREVAWVVESESRVAYVHGGVELAESSTYGDFYGFLRSVDGALEDAVEAAERHGVEPESTMVVEVRTRLVARAVFPAATEGTLGQSTYESVPGDWRVDGPGALEAFVALREGRGDGEDLPPFVSDMIEVPEDETVVWSTSFGRAEAETSRRAFEELARAIVDRGADRVAA